MMSERGLDIARTTIMLWVRRYARKDGRTWRVDETLGFKNFDYAAITIAGVEPFHRIRKGQFALHRLRLKDQAAPVIWMQSLLHKPLPLQSPQRAYLNIYTKADQFGRQAVPVKALARPGWVRLVVADWEHPQFEADHKTAS